MSHLVGPVGVIGGSGFVGTAVLKALRSRGVTAIALSAPRLGEPLSREAREATVVELVDDISEVVAVVNAAGVAESTGSEMQLMRGANAILPGVVAEAVRREGIRLIHVSSGAVQGQRPELDSTTDVAPFSPYSQSKAEGEAAVLASGAKAVVYRPPGVHGVDRSVTQTLARLARSPISSVAGDGRQGSANALIANVADAVAHLATTPSSPPVIVHHPSEGVTTATLLRALGGREPRHLSPLLARSLLAPARFLGRVHPPLMAHARRLEMLWFGQRQAPSWLHEDGWVPAQGLEEWIRMGDFLRLQAKRKETS